MTETLYWIELTFRFSLYAVWPSTHLLLECRLVYSLTMSILASGSSHKFIAESVKDAANELAGLRSRLVSDAVSGCAPDIGSIRNKAFNREHFMIRFKRCRRSL